MLKLALTYFLLTLIVLQSAMAMGDAHQLHQSGAEHLAFDDTHQHVDAPNSEQHHDHNAGSDPSSAEQWDCHHCCHCHGHLGPAILISIQRISLSKNSSPVPDYSEIALPETFETFLRPPKA